MYGSQVIPKGIKINYFAPIKKYISTIKQSFNINQAKTSTITHQSKTQSNTINQILNIINPLTNIEYQSSKNKHINPISTIKHNQLNSITIIKGNLNSIKNNHQKQSKTSDLLVSFDITCWAC